MKKLIFTALLIVGCGIFEEEDEITGWVCKLRTECFSPTDSTIIDCPLPAPSPAGGVDTTTVYSSFEGCDSVCVKKSELQIEGEDDNPYYCKENN